MSFLELLKLWWQQRRNTLETSSRPLRSLIQNQSSQVFLSLKRSYPEQKISVDWSLSKEELQALKRLQQSKGWRILSERLSGLEMELKDYALEATTYEESLHRRGYLSGISLVLGFFQSLSSEAQEELEVPRDDVELIDLVEQIRTR